MEWQSCWSPHSPRSGPAVADFPPSPRQRCQPPSSVTARPPSSTPPFWRMTHTTAPHCTEYCLLCLQASWRKRKGKEMKREFKCSHWQKEKIGSRGKNRKWEHQRKMRNVNNYHSTSDFLVYEGLKLTVLVSANMLQGWVRKWANWGLTKFHKRSKN